MHPDKTIKNAVKLAFGMNKNMVFSCRKTGGLVLESDSYLLLVKLVSSVPLFLMLLPVPFIVDVLGEVLPDLLLKLIMVVYAGVISLSAGISTGMLFLNFGHWRLADHPEEE